MNKSPVQTIATIRAQENFVSWVLKKMEETMTTRYELAQACGVEVKTISAVLNNQRSPKLDLVVKIFDYFDENWVQIPFYK